MPVIRKKDSLSPMGESLPSVNPSVSTTPKKPMLYKEEDGSMYKISFSEELQLKNLREMRKQVRWERLNFYAKLALIFLSLVMTVSILYVFYRLDAVNFFTNIMYR